MQYLITVIHVIAAICLVVLILLQQGKGATAGASFGSGASSTMFGSVGATPFLMKVSVILTTVFFITSISLSYLASREVRHQTQMTLTGTPSQ